YVNAVKPFANRETKLALWVSFAEFKTSYDPDFWSNHASLLYLINNGINPAFGIEDKGMESYNQIERGLTSLTQSTDDWNEAMLIRVIRLVNIFSPLLGNGKKMGVFEPLISALINVAEERDKPPLRSLAMELKLKLSETDQSTSTARKRGGTTFSSFGSMRSPSPQPLVLLHQEDRLYFETLKVIAAQDDGVRKDILTGFKTWGLTKSTYELTSIHGIIYQIMQEIAFCDEIPWNVKAGYCEILFNSVTVANGQQRTVVQQYEFIMLRLDLSTTESLEGSANDIRKIVRSVICQAADDVLKIQFVELFTKLSTDLMKALSDFKKIFLGRATLAVVTDQTEIPDYYFMQLLDPCFDQVKTAPDHVAIFQNFLQMFLYPYTKQNRYTQNIIKDIMRLLFVREFIAAIKDASADAGKIILLCGNYSYYAGFDLNDNECFQRIAAVVIKCGSEVQQKFRNVLSEYNKDKPAIQPEFVAGALVGDIYNMFVTYDIGWRQGFNHEAISAVINCLVVLDNAIREKSALEAFNQINASFRFNGSDGQGFKFSLPQRGILMYVVAKAILHDRLEKLEISVCLQFEQALSLWIDDHNVELHEAVHAVMQLVDVINQSKTGGLIENSCANGGDDVDPTVSRILSHLSNPKLLAKLEDQLNASALQDEDNGVGRFRGLYDVLLESYRSAGVVAKPIRIDDFSFARKELPPAIALATVGIPASPSDELKVSKIMPVVGAGVGKALQYHFNDNPVVCLPSDWANCNVKIFRDLSSPAAIAVLNQWISSANNRAICLIGNLARYKDASVLDSLTTFCLSSKVLLLRGQVRNPIGSPGSRAFLSEDDLQGVLINGQDVQPVHMLADGSVESPSPGAGDLDAKRLVLAGRVEQMPVAAFVPTQEGKVVLVSPMRLRMADTLYHALGKTIDPYESTPTITDAEIRPLLTAVGCDRWEKMELVSERKQREARVYWAINSQRDEWKQAGQLTDHLTQVLDVIKSLNLQVSGGEEDKELRRLLFQTYIKVLPQEADKLRSFWLKIDDEVPPESAMVTVTPQKSGRTASFLERLTTPTRAKPVAKTTEEFLPPILEVIARVVTSADPEVTLDVKRAVSMALLEAVNGNPKGSLYEFVIKALLNISEMKIVAAGDKGIGKWKQDTIVLVVDTTGGGFSCYLGTGVTARAGMQEIVDENIVEAIKLCRAVTCELLIWAASDLKLKSVLTEHVLTIVQDVCMDIANRVLVNSVEDIIVLSELKKESSFHRDLSAVGVLAKQLVLPGAYDNCLSKITDILSYPVLIDVLKSKSLSWFFEFLEKNSFSSTRDNTIVILLSKVAELLFVKEFSQAIFDCNKNNATKAWEKYKAHLPERFCYLDSEELLMAVVDKIKELGRGTVTPQVRKLFFKVNESQQKQSVNVRQLVIEGDLDNNRKKLINEGQNPFLIYFANRIATLDDWMSVGLETKGKIINVLYDNIDKFSIDEILNILKNYVSKDSSAKFRPHVIKICEEICECFCSREKLLFLISKTQNQDVIGTCQLAVNCYFRCSGDGIGTPRQLLYDCNKILAGNETPEITAFRSALEYMGVQYQQRQALYKDDFARFRSEEFLFRRMEYAASSITLGATTEKLPPAIAAAARGEAI
ncbi:MAG: hypothetical protein KAT71_05440, partial [Gammaproteobacteria bacterium]|nr:hypothetical protein [Gammaproteobacteria bacterium]